MKKLLLSLLVLVAATATKAQNVNMYIGVKPTADLENIEVTLYVDNDVEITGLQAAFEIPTDLTKDNYQYDDEEEMYFLQTSRTTKNHKKK